MAIYYSFLNERTLCTPRQDVVREDPQCYHRSVHVQNCLTTLRDEGGFFTVEDLHLAPDDQIRALPLLDGHKLSLLASKRGDMLSRSNSDPTRAAGVVGEGKLEDELFGSEEWEGERNTSR